MYLHSLSKRLTFFFCQWINTPYNVYGRLHAHRMYTNTTDNPYSISGSQWRNVHYFGVLVHFHCICKNMPKERMPCMKHNQECVRTTCSMIYNTAVCSVHSCLLASARTIERSGNRPKYKYYSSIISMFPTRSKTLLFNTCTCTNCLYTYLFLSCHRRTANHHLSIYYTLTSNCYKYLQLTLLR